MDELLEQFVIEGRELVQQASDDLLAMAEGSTDTSRIDSALRAIHTLKGSAGLFDMAPFGHALHAAEDVIASWRANRAVGNEVTLSLLLECIGIAGSWIEAIAQTGSLPQDAAARTRILAEGLRAGIDSPALAAAAYDERPKWLSILADDDADGRARSALRYEPQRGCFFVGDDPLALLRQLPELLAVRIVPRAPWSLPDYDPFACNLVIFALSAAPAEMVRSLFRFLPDQAEVVALPRQHAAPAAQPEAASRTLRVPLERIDALADLVGELFIAKNRIAFAAGGDGAETAQRRQWAAAQAELDRLAGFLHRAVMSLRLVPLEQSLRRLPLLVRETAARLGRDVGFTMRGTGIQADKGTADALFEPLLHILRNAVDHGIEPPATRAARGKPARGSIVLEAALDGGQVMLRVSDDGAGIDPARLRDVAAARGLVGPDQLAGLDEAALLDLVFLPGFSTAGEVTDTSGRGVGMDAVRSAIHSLGGQVCIARAPDGGTEVRMTVPQSLSMATVLTVQAGGDTFGVPVETVSELARIRRAAILPLRGGHAFVLRGRTIPLLDLARLLGREATAPGPIAQVLLAGAGDHRVGIEVDGFGERLDVVLRPLPALLAGASGVRGSALLGNGTLLMVLELSDLLG